MFDSLDPPRWAAEMSSELEKMEGEEKLSQ